MLVSAHVGYGRCWCIDGFATRTVSTADEREGSARVAACTPRRAWMRQRHNDEDVTSPLAGDGEGVVTPDPTPQPPQPQRGRVKAALVSTGAAASGAVRAGISAARRYMVYKILHSCVISFPSLPLITLCCAFISVASLNASYSDYQHINHLQKVRLTVDISNGGPRLPPFKPLLFHHSSSPSLPSTPIVVPTFPLFCSIISPSRQSEPG